MDLLKKHNMWDIPLKQYRKAPMETNWVHDPLSPLLNADKTKDYISLIASLQYLTQMTRPDMLFVVTTLAQFQKAPTQCDMKAAYRLLEYLRKTHDWGLFYQYGVPSDIIVYSAEVDDNGNFKPFHEANLIEGISPHGYVDASHGGEFDKKSRSAYVFCVFGCPVAWYSKKQTVTALSSTEAEVIALVEGIKEAIWMKNFLNELGFSIPDAITLHEDNQSAIAIAANPIHHARIKHMELKAAFLRENLENATVKFVYCPTEMMVADVLTKALPGPQHERLCRKMGMRSLAELEESPLVPEKALRVKYDNE
jgi:hypothetical protein